MDEDTTADYAVTLKTEPTGTVTVTITGHAGTDLSAERYEPNLHRGQLV